MQVEKGRGDDGVCLECSRRRDGRGEWSTRVKGDRLFRTVLDLGGLKWTWAWWAVG